MSAFETHAPLSPEGLEVHSQVEEAGEAQEESLIPKKIEDILTDDFNWDPEK